MSALGVRAPTVNESAIVIEVRAILNVVAVGRDDAPGRRAIRAVTAYAPARGLAPGCLARSACDSQCEAKADQ